MRSAFLLILGLLSVVPRVSAAGTRVWGMDADELSADLARSDYESLSGLALSRHRLEDAQRLGDDATFALGLIYLQLGNDEAGEELLQIAVRRAPQPWSGEAFLRLAQRYRHADRYEELESLARAVHDRDPTQEAGLALIEAWYRLGRFEDVELGFLRGMHAPGVQGADDRPDPDRPTAEAALWWAIARAELERPGWDDAVRSLYRDYGAAHAHGRVWVYLVTRPELLTAFTADELAFFRAKQLLSEGRSGEAAATLTELASGPEAPAQLLGSPWGVHDLYLAGLTSRRYGPVAEALRILVPHLDADGAARAYEYSGRLYRLAGAHGAAVSLLEASLRIQPDSALSRRVLWYLISSRVRQDPVAFVSRLDELLPLPGDPGYYGDVLAELAGALVQRGRFDALITAYEAIAPHASPGTLARYELVLARALDTGELPAAGHATGLRDELLARAAGQLGDQFTAFVAAALLGRDGVELLRIGEETKQSGEVRTPEGTLAATYLRYGLIDELFAVVRAAGAGVAPAMQLAAAARLDQHGDARRSILALSAFERSGGLLTPEVAALRYPRAFAPIIDARVVDEQVDAAVFYALVREESLFDPDISSSAGAIGLAQLMPATAADIAGRMRLPPPVLTDPQDNLTIGARYFAMLTRQFGTIARALAAYNAGQGNVRGWERRHPDLDEILFHQSIPFPETHNHARKVLVSAAYYAYLYDGRSPSDTVRLLFDL